MAVRDVLAAVRQYMSVLDQEGIPVAFAVLYGSFARGEEHEWSDIDLMVVSPLFDQEKRWEDIDHLWLATLKADVRIEPVGVGLKQWQEDDSIPLIEIARREGQIIRLNGLPSGRLPHEKIRPLPQGDDSDILFEWGTKEG